MNMGNKHPIRGESDCLRHYHGKITASHAPREAGFYFHQVAITGMNG